MQSQLEQLDPAQLEAVINTDGPALVIAGAGSGKTRVLTLRVAYLLSKGVNPYKILALTFTNKAAREMKERIGLIVGEESARRLWMGTFHSIFARILRSEASRIGFLPQFTIYDTADSKNVIKGILKELKQKEKDYKPGEVLSRISSAKNDLVLPPAYMRDANRQLSDKKSQMPLVGQIYARYMKACQKSGAMDFDDLLLNTNLLLRDHPDVLEKYQHFFEYILVDEYQDTNFSQYLILRKLAERHRNLCVVGDDAQSIYSFRGAKIENILNFRNDYPGYKLFKIERNYRSTRNIVNAANSIIANNKEQIKKTVFSENEHGDKIRIMQAYSDIEEGFLVVKDLMSRVIPGKTLWSDFAILYRANAQSRIFEEALRKQDIPYRIYGGLSFYQRKEIKDLLAYFRLSINPKDEEALKRVINYPTRGIGDTTVEKLNNAATANEMSIWEVLNHPSLQSLGFNAGTMRKLNGFTSLVNSFGNLSQTVDAFEAVSEITSKSGVLNELNEDNSIEGQTRLQNVEALISGVRLYVEQRKEEGEECNLTGFLEDVSLLTDADTDAPDDRNRVSLMTIHSAKGLEYKTVYIVGVEEGIFPSPFALNSQQALEEERRLFYVAITRASTNVAISYARSRYKYGDLMFVNPSRFLRDINPEFVEDGGGVNLSNGFKGFSTPGTTNQGQFPLKKSPPELFQNNRTRTEVPTSWGGETHPEKGNNLMVGARVEHDRFGIGEVIALEGIEPNRKATVDFRSAGVKHLLLKFAKLKILD